jgi:hypothetical protein
VKTKLSKVKGVKNAFNVLVGDYNYRTNITGTKTWIVRRTPKEEKHVPPFAEIKTDKGWVNWCDFSDQECEIKHYKKACDEMFE